MGLDGSLYLGGFTDGQTFPTTDGAYQRSLPAGAGRLGFVSRISGDGARLLLSTLFVDGLVSGLAVDETGAIHFLGPSSLTVLDAAVSHLILSKPIVGPNLVQIDANGNSYILHDGAALTAFDSAGAILLETQLPGFSVSAFIVMDDGAIVLAGATRSVNFPSRNTLQPCNMNVPHDAVPVQWWVMSAAFMVLDRSGTVLNASFMGGGAPIGYGNDGNGFTAMAKDRTGLVHLAGASSSPDFPGGTVLIPGASNTSS